MATAIRGRSATLSDLDGRTVLVVEDDPHLCGLINLLLEDEGYKPVSAANGLAALGLARRLRPALITLDLALPLMDGQRVLDQLAADERTCHIPVVVVSACADTLRPTEQVKRVMGKPFEIDDLLGTVGSVICRP